MPSSQVPGESRSAAVDEHAQGDAVEALRGELTTLARLAVGERVARFEHANQVLAAALAELDEV